MSRLVLPLKPVLLLPENLGDAGGGGAGTGLEPLLLPNGELRRLPPYEEAKLRWAKRGAGAGTGAGVGAGVGGAGVGSGVGAGVGSGVGAGVGAGVGSGSGAGTGLSACISPAATLAW